MTSFSEFLTLIMHNSWKWWTRDQNIDSNKEISFLVKYAVFINKIFFEKFWILLHMV